MKPYITSDKEEIGLISDYANNIATKYAHPYPLVSFDLIKNTLEQIYSPNQENNPKFITLEKVGNKIFSIEFRIEENCKNITQIKRNAKLEQIMRDSSN